MSTNEHHGREPSSVYVRRRLWVLAGFLAVVAIVALVIWKPGSTSGAEPEPTPTAKQSASATPGPSADAGEVGDCSADGVSVEALTDKSNYAAGETPLLSLRITNTGDAACSINVGTAAQVFTITSGSDTYWTSTDCQLEPADAIVELEAGQSVESTAPISWDRTRSTPSTCEGERPAVPAAGASYHLATSVDGIASEVSKQFILVG
ncbi:hypothetical protein IWX78_001883 [Mycetocola sp. CAN_C7]|uniref:hypothetical protein n=1 Tax=Mycetocola sp. CAN_C7 TaxID=2787724 RepID=UPI0018CBEB0C